jgi:hypothetical protein
VCAECRANPGPVPQVGVVLLGPFLRQIAWSQAPVLLGVCHSNATRPKEVLGFMFERCSQPGAPLRNRTVDLLLTMDHQTVPVSAAEALSRQNTSSRERRRAHVSTHWPHFAPQNAPHNDLHFIAVEDRLRRRAQIRSLLCLRNPPYGHPAHLQLHRAPAMMPALEDCPYAGPAGPPLCSPVAQSSKWIVYATANPSVVTTPTSLPACW